MKQSDLKNLAQAGGIEPSWLDVRGDEHVISADTLRAVLTAIGLPAEDEEQIAESFARLRREDEDTLRPLITAELNSPILVPGQPGRFRLTMETGGMIEGNALQHAEGVVLPAIREPGYHRLEFNETACTIAVAPARAFTLEDAAQGKKLWGLAVQLYALRRKNGGAVGDFAALAEFARAAARRGADAVAISPVHAQFAADVTRYGPYSPSSRSALNVMHIPLDDIGPDNPALIDWPNAASQSLRQLREQFQVFDRFAELDAFRQASGDELHQHAVFEALSAALGRDDPAALDYRNWPQEYQDPQSPAVLKFADEHRQDVDFHAWLQYRADAALQAAQKAARDAGMKIGLIADLAVGTHPTGSQSWSRQDQVLRKLQVGAPPDLVNTNGQSWGITAFSPRGLRNSGFSAFIDMLRHALRHAGGVRIDHVMGLARLWVIPEGFSARDGAYLQLPADDLMRLVALESHRHKAIILGEDLGTLPAGFGKKLDHAGIAGMRVMWFERKDDDFVAPALWTREAVAMTTTHDLPSVAGWWQATDIAWRQKLNLPSDTIAQREADRALLWATFQASGATRVEMPDADNGAAVADAACAHLGLAGCTLALLPIEDAIGTVEQPNLPGTIHEHPNWRRRLPADADELFARPDVAARLAALDQARRK